MLRFTLHRPSQNSAVSTCCHGMSCRDISCRVHVGVPLMPASHTHEDRLALASLRCDVLAGVTGLRRVRSFDLLDPTGSLLLQPGHEQTPPGFEDAPIEARLLGDVPARLLHGSPRGAGHALDVEALDPDHVETGGEVGAGFLNPVFAPVAVPGFQLADQGLHLPAAVRPAPGAREPALEPQEPLGFFRAQPSRAGHLAGGQRHRDGDTTIHTDDLTCARRGDRFGNHSERDMPTTRPVTGNAVRPPVRQVAAAFERNPTDLWDQHTRPCPVVLTDPQRLRSHDPQALMLAGFTPRRATMGSGEEPLPRLVKIPQRLLLDGLRPAGKPRLRSPGGSQLRGLGVESRTGSFPTRPHQALLEAEVPHIPGVAALPQQEHLLCSARVQPEPHGTQRSSGLRHPGRNQTPILGAVAAPSTTSTSIWCSSPHTGVACSTRRCSACANSSWRRCAQTSARLWPSSTQPKTMFTCSCSTRRRWRSPTWSTHSRAFRLGGCGRTSSAGSTRLRYAAGYGPRHTSLDHVAVHRSASSRTTSQTRNDQTRQSFHPAPKDRVSTPKHLRIGAAAGLNPLNAARG